MGITPVFVFANHYLERQLMVADDAVNRANRPA
jgi:hypothetical protein